MTSRTCSIDAHVGRRIRRRRVELGLTQEHLARQLGVSHQQLHYYEGAKNRVSFATAHKLARILGVGVSYFLAGLHDEVEIIPIEEQAPSERVALQIGASVRRIGDMRHLLALARLARALEGER